MSKNELQRSGEHRRCGFANGARELCVTFYRKRDWYGGGKSLQFAVIFIIMLE